MRAKYLILTVCTDTEYEHTLVIKNAEGVKECVMNCPRNCNHQLWLEKHGHEVLDAAPFALSN